MSRKKIIILGSVTLFFAVTLFLVYYLAIYRAESSLRKLVDSQSNGKLKLDVKNADLDIFHLRFNFKQPELRTQDSTNAASGYHVKAEEISIEVHSLVSLLLNWNIIIESVIIQSPRIEVIKYKEALHKKFSLPEEMNKVYQSLEKVLKVLNLKYLHIADAKFSLINQLEPAAKPIIVSNINLTVDNVTSDREAGDKKFLFADRILLEIYNQNLILPDGNHGVSFKKLWLGTRTRKLVLDSCVVYGKSNDASASEFNIYFDSLRITKLDFNQLATDNTIKFDSAVCVNPDINIKLHIKGMDKKVNLSEPDNINRDSIDLRLKNMLGNLDIGYLGVKNAKVKIQIEKNKKFNVFRSLNDNFSFSDLLVNSKSDIPIHLGQFEIDLKDYTRYSPDSMDIISFDKIIINQEKIKLYNFNINPSKKNHSPLRREMKMQVLEIDDIDWAALLYEHRISAGHASLVRPEIHLVLPEPDTGNAGKVKKNPFKMLAKVRDKVQIGEFFIENGAVRIEELNGIKLAVDNCYAGINVNRLLQSENSVRATDAIDTFAFSKGTFDNRSVKFLVQNGRFSGKSRSVSFALIQETKKGQNSSISIKDVSINGLDFRSSSNFFASKLSWRQADISINLLRKENGKSKGQSQDSKLRLTIKEIQGGPSKLMFFGDNIEASTEVNLITSDVVIIEPGKNPVINGLNIDGHSINLQQKKIHGNIGGFKIRDNQKSTIENIEVTLPVGNEVLRLFIPRFDFSADINQSINGKLSASFMELHKPVISFVPKQENTEIQEELGYAKLPLLNVGRLTINEPELKNVPSNLAGKIELDPGKLNLNFIGLVSENEKVKIDSVRFNILNPGFSSGKIMIIKTDNASASLNVSDFLYQPAVADAKASWYFTVNAFRTSGLKFNLLQDSVVKQKVAVTSVNINNLNVNSSYLKDLKSFEKYNEKLAISNGNITFENDKIRFGISNLLFSKSAGNISVDSLVFYPLADRDAFMASKEYQSNYMQLYSGRISIKGIDFNLLLNDTVINSKKITVNDVHFLSYKDKRLPFRHGIEKPMLTDMLRQLNLKIMVDSLVVKDSKIEYEEFNDKTLKYGNIDFTRLRGAITGIKNYNLTVNDSLRFNMYARFMNATDLRLKYAQSFSDSLSGFHLKVIASSFDLTKLNPLLAPFASAEAKSGYLDTLRMSVTGRKHLAYGVMKMYYHDLNVQYLDKGNEGHQSLKAKSISFFANRLVHKKNQRGTGDVFAERDPEKGFVNYWVKIFIGGVLTNTGVRTDNKQQRKYKKSIKNYHVPEIPDIPVDY